MNLEKHEKFCEGLPGVVNRKNNGDHDSLCTNDIDTTVDSLSLEDRIAALAQLPPIEYDQQRKTVAKKVGVQLKTLDLEVAKARGADGLTEGNQADVAIALFNNSGARLFHDDQDIAFAELPVDDHMEIWPVESKQFRKWLNRMFWNDQKKALKEQSRKDAIGTIAGLAEIEGDEHRVFLRVAHHNGRHYIDLCDDEWRVIEIDESGWRVMERSPIKFRRTSNMEPLPVPLSVGDFHQFWNLVNVSESDQPFILVWLIDSLRANTQYPLLEIVGGHGSAKSTLHRFIRRLLDPNVIDLRGAPRTDSDIWVAAKNNHVVSFENMSTLSAKMQDVLCTVATGGGHAGRELYTDHDEAVVKASNPAIINGINPVVTASDLSDRTIRIQLPKINGANLREEHEIITAFEHARSGIFTGLLDIFVAALGEIGNIKLAEKPRMVSYSILGEAVGKSLSWEESFNENYLNMRASLLIEATQSSPVIMAIVSLITDRGTFIGTYKDLLTSLDEKYHSRGEGWPASPRGLSGLITRHEPGLVAMGYKISRDGHGRAGSTIKIESAEKSIAPEINNSLVNDRHNDHNRHKFESGDDGDGCDGQIHVKKQDSPETFSEFENDEEIRL